MPIKTIFTCNNNFSQGSRKLGICTCASLNWVKATLKKGGARGIGSLNELPDLHSMNGVMAVLRGLDANPQEQCELVGTRCVHGDVANLASAQAVAALMQAQAPHIGIFWTLEHTMGIRCEGGTNEFFDIEQGLFLADSVAEIASKIATNYGGPFGARVVGL